MPCSAACWTCAASRTCPEARTSIAVADTSVLSRAYAARVHVASIDPPAQSVAVEEGRQVYSIETSAPELAVTLVMEAVRVGTMSGEVGLVDGPSVAFTQLVLF